jgi:hypothetical protein
MRYVLGAPSSASSNTPPRLPDQEQDVVTNTIGSSEASSSLGWSTFYSPVTRSEVLKRPCDHIGSSVSFFASVVIEAHSDALELRPGSPLPATAVYSEEEEFLANMSGDTNDFGVRSCCFCPGPRCAPAHAYLVSQISPIGRHHWQGEL